MAYKLICIHPFHDHHSGRVIQRGEEILDYDHIHELVSSDRGHHFRRAHLPMEEVQWHWPTRKGGNPHTKKEEVK
jgi:hypothetical protein